MMVQDILFSQECIAETGLWCELNDGINPAHWARVCRFLGHLTPERFKKACSLLRHFGDVEIQCQPNLSPLPRPLVSLGPSGIGGQYQQEWL